MIDKGEEQIRRAIEDGCFENLPGKGKPLNLDENPFEDPEWRMANQVLVNAGYSLPWIESRREIEAEIEAARRFLKNAWERRKAAPASASQMGMVEQQWQRAARLFREKIAGINKRILNYNLEAPLPQVQMLSLNAEQEVEKIRDE